MSRILPISDLSRFLVFEVEHEVFSGQRMICIDGHRGLGDVCRNSHDGLAVWCLELDLLTDSKRQFRDQLDKLRGGGWGSDGDDGG